MNRIFSFILLFSILSCTYTERITNGSMAFDRKQYAVAIEMLAKEYNQTKNKQEKAKKAYQLGESYRRNNQYDKAAEWFENAVKEDYGKDCLLKQAQMLQQAEKYEDAISVYRNAGRNEGNANLYMEQIVACRQAKLWISNPKDANYKTETLKFNNASTDFSPIIFKENQLVFSSDRTQSSGKNKYKWTGQKFFDLYSWTQKEDTVKLFTLEGFDPKYHQGNLVFNKDQTEVFFTQCGSDNKEQVDFCKVMTSRKNGSSWSTPVELRLGATNVNNMHPCVDENGKWLIYASNDKNGFGGYDLYISLWIESENRWSEGKNMGSGINTKGNEVFPTLDKDTLYYSSDGLPGMGGLDIYKAIKFYERWKDPVNLQFPVNSGGDDFGFIVDPFAVKTDSFEQLGFFCSNRKAGKGSDDIYKFSKFIPKIPDTPVVVDTTPKIEFVLLFEGKVKEKILAQPGNPSSEVSGYKDLMGSTIRISNQDTAWSVGSNEDGTFTVKLEPGKEYYFHSTKSGFLSSDDTLSTKSVVLTPENPKQTLKKEFYMTPIFKGKEIVLKDVKFDFDKWDIRPDAAAELDKLVVILQQNPELNILMSSHTDCRGSDRDNLTLSQRRAASTMQYLVTKGIAQNRLTARGFGETVPAAQCACNLCTEAQHQENRRTSFMIVD